MTKTAIDVREAASIWLAHKTLGPWTEVDQTALDAWLAESLAHEVAFIRMEAGWDRAGRMTALRDPAMSIRRPARRPRKPGFKVALALSVMVVAIASATQMFPKTNAEIYSTSVGGHKIITLSDGSHIELNTDTKILANFHRSRREVTLLKGEAYFQIEHDATRPFVVMVAEHRVTDLGTKFVVRSKDHHVLVSLIEGKAELQSADSSIQQHSVVLMPGDVALASADALSVSRRPDKELRDELGWRRGLVVFSHVTLAEAAAEFNRYNATKIVITDAVARKRTIGATLPARDVNAFAEVAREVFGLHIERRKNEILISR